MQFPVYPQASLLDSSVVEMSCLARLIFGLFRMRSWIENAITFFLFVLINLECFSLSNKVHFKQTTFDFFQIPFIWIKLLKSARSHCSFKFREQCLKVKLSLPLSCLQIDGSVLTLVESPINLPPVPLIDRG